MQGYIKVAGTSFKQILFYTAPLTTVGVVVSDEGIEANDEHKKIIKAGTPVVGNLEDRDDGLFTVVDGNEEDVVGVLLHDVDVTNGPENSTCVIFGYIDLEKVEDEAKALITDKVKEVLDSKVTFLKP